MPTPMPVIDVNSGCANGESSPRRTKVATMPAAGAAPASVNARPK